MIASTVCGFVEGTTNMMGMREIYLTPTKICTLIKPGTGWAMGCRDAVSNVMDRLKGHAMTSKHNS